MAARRSLKGFCDADDVCYGNMHPKISWDRTKTIGHGDDICDFKVHIKEN
ncbi:MAG: L-2-amino-thiazoline-4-carboxylic acid hydrolase [Blautia sp.]|nr:L-2-amino-thiazoline-4-carboxylic acid hydrolase [Blautia sp.]